MTSLPITLATAATLGIMLIWLSARVIASRVKHQALIGDQDNEDLLFAIRTQANLSEYSPIFLILLGLLELSQANPTALKVFAGLFVFSRLAHVLGMGVGANLRLRQLGMVGTFTAILAASIHGLYSVLS